jgi:acetyl-CoA decarbonylase/synthase complex subunit gamma
MALSGVEIFKHLPKTNCKKCGFPTCLAFAMALAAQKVSLDQCPDVSDEAKKFLGAAAEPPIRGIALGPKGIKVGEETVLFRHEKKFVNPCPIALNIKDTEGADAIARHIADVNTSEIDRVGQMLRVDLICVSNDSGDPGKFAAVVKQVVDGAPNAGMILNSINPASIEAALAHCADRKPLVYGANADNLDAMANIAKTKNVPLGIYAKGLDALSDLSEKVKGMGINDIVLDSGARTAKEMVEEYTMIRRAALKKSFKPFGYPVISFVRRDDPAFEATIASLGIMKYASIIVVESIEKWKSLALLTLRQNIYTDPQVPMQVEQKIYKIGDANENSPLLVTTNFSLTYFIVRGEIENSKVPAWLAIMNVEGLSVLTAWAAGKFVASSIANFVKESGADKLVAKKELIIPGYVAVLSGALEDKIGEGWKVTVGPREANQLPSFLKGRVQ